MGGYFPRARWMAVAAWAAVGAACTVVPGYQRAATVRLAETRLDPDRLEQWGEAELGEGRAQRAFYALELARSLPLFARKSAAERAPGLPPAHGALAGAFVRAESTGPLRLTSASLDALRSAAAAEQDLFLQEWEQTEARLAGFENTATYLEWPYRRLYDGGRVVATVRDVQLALGPRDLLLSYLVGSRRAYVFAVTTDGFRAVALPEPPEVLGTLANDLVSRLATRAAGWEVPAARLYAALLGPVAQELGRCDSLVLVSGGALSGLPFAVLAPAPGAAPLVETHRLTGSPSFSLYLLASGRPLSNAPPRLLDVASEARSHRTPAFQRVFDEPRLLGGETATRSALLKELGRASVLSLRVPAALDDRAPLAASFLLSDGALSAAEIVPMSLRNVHAALLAGTEAAWPDPRGRAAETLAGSFLLAGVPSTVLRLWRVEDEVADRVFVGFLSRLLEEGSAEALRGAQRELRASPSTAHPHFWAAFVSLGWGK